MLPGGWLNATAEDVVDGVGGADRTRRTPQAEAHGLLEAARVSGGVLRDAQLIGFSLKFPYDLWDL